jgi:hypothetical protein
MVGTYVGVLGSAGTAFRDLVTFVGAEITRKICWQLCDFEFGQRNRHSECVPRAHFACDYCGHLAVFKHIP